MSTTIKETKAGTTYAERWTVSTYPRAMYPVMERPIAILFDDEVLGHLASLSLEPEEALELARALERAAWERKCIRNS